MEQVEWQSEPDSSLQLQLANMHFYVNNKTTSELSMNLKA